MAEGANEIFGTGQVFRAGRNLTPPIGTSGGGRGEGEKGCGPVRHAGASLLCVWVLYHCACKDSLEGI